MAKKRMFTMLICDSDAFLDMPLSSQCLYFHLCMRADDDGFVDNAKRITRLIGASEDDLKLLIAKRFVLTFESGVIVIKHWRMHNTLSAGRYHETQYLEEKSMLMLKDNNSYSFNTGQPIDDAKNKEIGMRQSDKTNNRRTIDEQVESADKDLDIDLGLNKGLDKEKDNSTVSKDTVCRTQDVQRVIEKWNDLSDVGIKKVKKIGNSTKAYQMLIARINEYGIDDVLNTIDTIRNSDFLLGRKTDFSITFDWFIKPNNFQKVYNGNYINNGGYSKSDDRFLNFLNGGN